METIHKIFAGLGPPTPAGRGKITLFGVALGCTILPLLAFVADSLLAWHSFRQQGSVPLSTKASRTKGGPRGRGASVHLPLMPPEDGQ